jgi:hypothetical protein
MTALLEAGRVIDPGSLAHLGTQRWIHVSGSTANCLVNTEHPGRIGFDGVPTGYDDDVKVLTIEQQTSEPIRYRRMMKLFPIAAFAIAVGLFLAPVGAQQASPKAHEHDAPAPQAGGMTDHDKMMAAMKVADAKLEALTRTMKSASGNDKIPAMQELLTALVQNHVDMHRQMSMMHDHMMSQMPHK